MNIVKLVPCHLNPKNFAPIDNTAKAVLMSFGFYDFVNSDYRTLDQWKATREVSGNTRYIRFFIPAYVTL